MKNAFAIAKIANASGAELAQGSLRTFRLALEHADRLGTREQVSRFCIVRWNGLEIERWIMFRLDHRHGVCEHGERVDAEQVEFRQPDGFHIAVFVLGDQETFWRPLEGRNIGHGAR